MLAIQQSSTARGIPLPCFSAAAPQSGITPTLKIKLHPTDAGSTPSGTITASDSSGFAELVPSATDFGTVGYYKIEVSGTGIDTRVVVVMVTAYDPFNVLPSGNAGSGSLVTTGNLPANFSATSISAGGKVAATLAPADVSGNLPADLQTIKGQVVTATGAFSFDAQATEQTNTAAIKAQTDKLQFDAANNVKSDTQEWAGGVVGALVNGGVPASLVSTQANYAPAKATDQIGLDLTNIKQAAVATTLTNISLGGSVASVTGSVGSVAGNVGGSVGSVSGAVTVGTNNDKTGYSLVSAPPTAAAIATAIWQDTTAGDFNVAGSVGKIVFAQLGGAFTSGTSVFTSAALQNAPAGGGGGGFSGANAVTLVFHDAGGNPVPNVVFTVVGVGTAATDASGQITVGLNNGSYTIRAAPTSGTLFASTPITVSGADSFTITGTAVVIPPATAPGQTNAYCYTRDAAGNLVGGKTIEFRLTSAPPTGDTYTGPPLTATSDPVTALLQVTLAKSAAYQTSGGATFTTGTGATFALPEMIA